MKFFIDENMPVQLAEGLAMLEKPNNDGVEIFSIQKEYGRGIQDEDWIPQVGQINGIVITQDYNIQRTQNQFALLKQYKIGIFYLRPPGKTGYKYWEMVEKIITHWKAIKEIVRQTKSPFAFRIMPRGKIERIA
ncbi:MAG TPA: hypothetical protein VHM26_02850 [Chitinophagaceae bacterium]|jgi:hypothetical protein|nr:hypothetical protein [Chitinophagaceae bacterium]